MWWLTYDPCDSRDPCDSCDTCNPCDPSDPCNLCYPCGWCKTCCNWVFANVQHEDLGFLHCGERIARITGTASDLTEHRISWGLQFTSFIHKFPGSLSSARSNLLLLLNFWGEGEEPWFWRLEWLPKPRICHNCFENIGNLMEHRPTAGRGPHLSLLLLFFTWLFFWFFFESMSLNFNETILAFDLFKKKIVTASPTKGGGGREQHQKQKQTKAALPRRCEEEGKHHRPKVEREERTTAPKERGGKNYHFVLLCFTSPHLTFSPVGLFAWWAIFGLVWLCDIDLVNFFWTLLTLFTIVDLGAILAFFFLMFFVRFLAFLMFVAFLTSWPFDFFFLLLCDPFTCQPFEPW